ncbi:MAG: hypothetical protein WBM99_05670 [Psychromonas sp.]
MSKKSYQENTSRIPESFEGIQSNGCNNPKCENFNVAPVIYKNHYDSQIKAPKDESYAISGYGKQLPALKCKSCGNISPIKSNIAIHEEKQRLGAYLLDKPTCCPNTECINNKVSIFESPISYSKFGMTSGNQRYRCKSCKKTFSLGNKRRAQKRSEINKSLFVHLMNKIPVNRCCEVLDISPQTYYRKVDWLYEKALGFVRERERKLLKNVEIPRLYLSTDRQVHTSNWTQRNDKRNTELLAIGTADNISSYVFGWHFNFDPHAYPPEVEEETINIGDYENPIPFRKHARLWLPRDYLKAQQNSKLDKRNASDSILGDVAQKYNQEHARSNPEAVEEIDNTVKAPIDGMLVHSEYTMYGHFQLLRELLSNTEKVRFYLDQEAGIKNAFMTAFRERVNNQTADAFYVRTNKNFTVDNKERLIQESHRRIQNRLGIPFNSLSAQDKERAVMALVMEEMQCLRKVNGSRESWLSYPFATKSEPEKILAALTDISNLSKEHQARLYMKGSLHGIDRFFMQARRRVNAFERPFNSGTNARRTWYGYSPYNPEMYIKLAELFRLFYNYVNIGKDKKTPAMRLGLAKGPVSYEKIIYFDSL